MRKAILSKVAGATATVMMATSLFVPTFAEETEVVIVTPATSAVVTSYS